MCMIKKKAFPFNREVIGKITALNLNLLLEKRIKKLNFFFFFECFDVTCHILLFCLQLFFLARKANICLCLHLIFHMTLGWYHLNGILWDCKILFSSGLCHLTFFFCVFVWLLFSFVWKRTSLKSETFLAFLLKSWLLRIILVLLSLLCLVNLFF